MEPSDNEQMPDDADRKATNGTTDEELTPLHWLHDKNLLKGKIHTQNNFMRVFCKIAYINSQELICHVLKYQLMQIKEMADDRVLRQHRQIANQSTIREFLKITIPP